MLFGALIKPPHVQGKHLAYLLIQLRKAPELIINKVAESIRGHFLVGHKPLTSRALNHISKDAIDQGKEVEPEISLQVPDLLGCLEVRQVKLGH